MNAIASPKSTVSELASWLRRHRRVFVLTGAGCSTASGIPDYRGADGTWKRRPPVTYQAFTQDAMVRARYWARSYIGWPVIEKAVPNDAHASLAQWEQRGGISLLVTQNVDGLHQRAGSRRVVDLHGCIDQVRCLQCDARVPRADVQEALRERNPEWAQRTATIAPDGDADLDGVDFRRFAIPWCWQCEGMLKPDVVFFGENVPRDRVSVSFDALQASDAMLVLGSSLMVYSGYRLARMASEAGLPLAIVSLGKTRADELAQLKVWADCGTALRGAL